MCKNKTKCPHFYQICDNVTAVSLLYNTGTSISCVSFGFRFPASRVCLGLVLLVCSPVFSGLFRSCLGLVQSVFSSC
jgi:hypothetical protein